MKRNLKNLIDFSIGATDGEIGKVKDFYFDDKTWTIRYLIVETGDWFSARKVLISPQALLVPDWENEVFPIKLTKEQIKNSPDIDSDKPVSRQEEIKLAEYYPWEKYWGSGMEFSSMSVPGLIALNATGGKAEAEGDPNLRSMSKVTGYNIKALDREIGDVDDFIINEKTWIIEYILVDTGKWLPGKKVLIVRNWIREIKWALSEVIVNALAEQIRNSPEYVASKELSSFYEADLTNYYASFPKDAPVKI